MLYVTHCTSQIMAITGERFTHVSGQGFVDTDPDAVFDAEKNRWSNPFSNQAALLRMSDGSSCRANVYWRVGHPSMVQMSIYGTDASFEYTYSGAHWMDRLARDGPHPADGPGMGRGRSGWGRASSGPGGSSARDGCPVDPAEEGRHDRRGRRSST